MTNEIMVQTEVVDAKASTALQKAKDLVIRTPGDFTASDAECAALAALGREIESTFNDGQNGEKDKGPVPLAYATWKAGVAAREKHLAPVIEARKIRKEKMSAWQDAEDAKRRAEEMRLQEEARKKAEEEALDAAAAEEGAGNHEQADAIISAPVVVAPVVLAKTTPKAQTVIRKVWAYRVDKDPKDLTNAELLAARAYLTWDTTKLNNQAKATQDTVKVAGVSFFQKAC